MAQRRLAPPRQQQLQILGLQANKQAYLQGGKRRMYTVPEQLEQHLWLLPEGQALHMQSA